MKPKRNTGLYAYLEKAGVLGMDDAAIKHAKREYYLQYRRNYMREKRSRQKEYRFVCSAREEKELLRSAADHDIPLSRFIKECVFSYIRKAYIVQDRRTVAEIRQILVRVQDAIQRIEAKDNAWLKGNYGALEAIVSELRLQVSKRVEHPPSLEEAIRNALSSNPHFRQTLESILKDDT